MMILAQSGQKIVSTDNFNYIQVEEKERHYKDFVYHITAFYTQDQTILGAYKTAKRANEILQDMYKQIMVQNFSFTYEMPKE